MRFSRQRRRQRTNRARGLTRCQNERRHHHNNNIIPLQTCSLRCCSRAERQYIKSSGKENENRNSRTRATIIIKYYFYILLLSCIAPLSNLKPRDHKYRRDFVRNFWRVARDDRYHAVTRTTIYGVCLYIIIIT